MVTMTSLLSCFGATNLHKSKKATGRGAGPLKKAMHDQKKRTSRLSNESRQGHEGHRTSEAVVACESSATSSMEMEKAVAGEKNEERVRDSFDPRAWRNTTFKELTSEETTKTRMDSCDDNLWKKNDWLLKQEGCGFRNSLTGTVMRYSLGTSTV